MSATDTGRTSPASPLDRTGVPPSLLAGTSSWSSEDWVGPFYPPGTAPADFLRVYASRLPTVEVDATFYRPPSRRIVDGWNAKTPDDFVLSAKVPRIITHEKALDGAGDDMARFLETMGRLGPKLGPLVLQFPYVAKGKDAEEYRTGARFRERLDRFLQAVPEEFRVAVEVRNATWLDEDLAGLLRRRRAALVWSAYSTMPDLARLERTLDPVTADFGFVRFLGDRRRMDKLLAARREREGTRRDFDTLVVDRRDEMRRWIPSLERHLGRLRRLFVYCNNHYAGYGPGSVAQFLAMWREAAEGAGGASRAGGGGTHGGREP